MSDIIDFIYEDKLKEESQSLDSKGKEELTLKLQKEQGDLKNEVINEITGWKFTNEELLDLNEGIPNGTWF